MCHQLHSLCGLQLAIMAARFCLANYQQLPPTLHQQHCPHRLMLGPAGAIPPCQCATAMLECGGKTFNSIDTFWKPSSQSPIISDSFQTRSLAALQCSATTLYCLLRSLKFKPPLSHLTVFSFPHIRPLYPPCLHNRQWAQ